jgi:hypothetical protein
LRFRGRIKKTGNNRGEANKHDDKLSFVDYPDVIPEVQLVLRQF